MRVIAADSETGRIEPGLLTPPLVCVSWAERKNGVLQAGIFTRNDALAFYRAVLELAVERQVIMVLQNGVYDLGVACAEDDSLIELVFEAYRVGAIRDVKERQKLIDLADGRMKFARDEEGEFRRQIYNLAVLAKRHTGRSLDKEDTWRLRYIELLGVPLEEWPEEAIHYALMDAVATLEIYEGQNQTQSPVVRLCDDGIVRVTNEEDQLRAHWGLHLQSIWGVRTDGEAVSELKNRLVETRDRLRADIMAHDQTLPKEQRIYRVHQITRGPRKGVVDITKNMKGIYARVEAAFAAKGVECPRTPTGLAGTAEDVLMDAGDEILNKLGGVAYGDKVLGTYMPALEFGVDHVLNVPYNLLLETGRTSCPNPRDGYPSFSPQVQPRPRSADKGAFDWSWVDTRHCAKPRPGYYYCSVDFDQIELVCLGQVLFNLFGRSSIGAAINDGKDLHVAYATEYLKVVAPQDYAGLTYEEAIDWYKRVKKAKGATGDNRIVETRQLSKVPNFGLPGGMGILAFIDFAWKSYGVRLTYEQGALLKEIYLATFSDMPDYFAWASRMVGPAGECSLVQWVSGRIRGGVGYTQLCNGNFQSLAADGAKAAVWDVSVECHVKKDSPLYGSHPVMFIHDEIVAEVPIDRAHEAAFRMRDVMVAAMQRYVPDVKVSAKPALMERWWKQADDVYDDNGRLIPWKPKERT